MPEHRVQRTSRLLAAAILSAVSDKRAELAEERVPQLILDNDFVSGAALVKRELISHQEEFRNVKAPNHSSFIRKMLARCLWTSGYLMTAYMLKPHRTELVADVLSYDPTRYADLSVRFLDSSLREAVSEMDGVRQAVANLTTAEDIIDQLRTRLPVLDFRRFVLLEAHLYDDEKSRRAVLAGVLGPDPIPSRAVGQIMAEPRSQLLASRIYEHRRLQLERSGTETVNVKALREASVSDAAAMVMLGEHVANSRRNGTSVLPKFVSLTSAIHDVLSTEEFCADYFASASVVRAGSVLDDPNSVLRSYTYLVVRGIFESVAFGGRGAGTPARLGRSLGLKQLEEFASTLLSQTTDDAAPEEAKLLLESFTNDAGLAAFIDRVWMPSASLKSDPQVSGFHRQIAVKFPEVDALRTTLEANRAIVKTIIDMDLDEFASDLRMVSKWAHRASEANANAARVASGILRYYAGDTPTAGAAMGVGRWLCMLENPMFEVNVFLRQLDTTTQSHRDAVLSDQATKWIGMSRSLRLQAIGAALGLCIGQLELVRAAKVSYVEGDELGAVAVGRLLDLIAVIQREGAAHRMVAFEILRSRIDYLLRRMSSTVGCPMCLVVACAWGVFYWLIEWFMYDKQQFLVRRADREVSKWCAEILGNAKAALAQLAQENEALAQLSQAEAVCEMLDTLLNHQVGQLPKVIGHESAGDPYVLDARTLRESMHHLLSPPQNPAGQAIFADWRSRAMGNRLTTPDASIERYREFIQRELLMVD